MVTSAKGDTLISMGKSSAFLLLAPETTPRAASVQGFFASSGHEKGKQGALTVVGLSIVSSTGGQRAIEVRDSRRRSRQDDIAGKEVKSEDKARWIESDVAHVLARGVIVDNPFSQLLQLV
ncbi:hypothetical protein PoB_003870200 [Plakobranchus ocellatus]|uniref:Uncharacterized protein n=1 Tax=Plakobranchus ocellatus TaxID=259542 RepID=A0AAV4AZ78_9GAST|nr:hypothetical protein PoB_003870200 [Plakobranchus ocellatus]